MSTLELEEVASDCIEVEVDTSDILLLEPLLDHNYILKSQTDPAEGDTQIIKLNARRKLNKLPKITTLQALYNCMLCGFMTMKKECIVAHREMHKKTEPQKNIVQMSNNKLVKKTKPTQNIVQSKPLKKKQQGNKCHKPVKKHVLEDKYECPKCSYSSKSNIHLKVHMHIHTKGNPYKCRGCSYAGEELKDLINHYKMAQNMPHIECLYSRHYKKQNLQTFTNQS